jgi:hypothetical protein
MFIEQPVCRKNPEYIALIARTATRQPSTTPSLFNGLTNTQRDRTLLSSKIKTCNKLRKTSIRIILRLFFSFINAYVGLQTFNLNSRYA